MSLFQRGDFTLHSGGRSGFLINADALTDEDLEALAALIADRIAFSEVHGIPRGGDRIAAALRPYRMEHGPILICDDVCTSGASLEGAKIQLGAEDAVGVVLFARGPCPAWVRPVFRMWGAE